jgi:hypothetical protein
MIYLSIHVLRFELFPLAFCEDKVMQAFYPHLHVMNGFTFVYEIGKMITSTKYDKTQDKKRR